MAQTLEQGDIFGRIGKAIGQGAGEQVERGMLARGLENISKNPNLTDIERFSALSRLPGGLEHAQTLVPLLRQQQQRTQIKQRHEGIAGEEKVPIENIPEKRRSESDYLLPKSQEERRKIGEELFLQDPVTYPTLEAAISEATTRDESRIAKERAYEERVELGRNELKRYNELFLQKPGNEKFKDLTGEMIGEFESLLKSDIDSGKNPREAAKQRGEQMLELAKARQQVSLEGAKKAYNSLPSKSRGVLSNLREDYKKNNQLNLYQKDLVNKVGMTPSFSSILAFPVSENKSIISPIKSYSKNPSAAYDKIVDSLGKNDSLLSIAIALEENAGRGKGQQFLDRIASDPTARKDLTDRQLRELGETFNPNPSLTDLFYTSIIGKKAGI